MAPHIPKHTSDPATWLFTMGGMIHRCSNLPEGEAQVITQQAPDGTLLPVYGYAPCRMEVLQGEEAEDWALLRNSLKNETGA